MRWLLPPLLALQAPVAPATDNDLPLAVDLRAEAEQARQAGGPLIVVFSRPDCKYCQTVKRDYLKRLAANPRYPGVLVRQINQDSDAPLTGFRGERTTQARFAGTEKIKLVPVVAFYGPDGKRLVEPIVGARLPRFLPDLSGGFDREIDGSAQGALSSLKIGLAGRLTATIT